MGEVEVLPTIGGGDGGIELHVDGAHAVYIRVGTGLQARVVDEVVELGEAELAAQHDLAPLGVQCATDDIQLRRRLRPGESLKDVRRGVPNASFQG